MINAWFKKKDAPIHHAFKEKSDEARMDETLCDICGEYFKIERYGEGKCPVCGAEYQYNEGYSLILSDSQREILKTAVTLESTLKQEEE